MISLKNKKGNDGDFKIALVGDSDIERWEQESQLSENDSSTWNIPIVAIRGKSGAVLADIVPMAKQIVQQSSASSNLDVRSNLIVIACAGENDIGEGIYLDKTIDAMKDFLNAIFFMDSEQHSASAPSVPARRHLIFLGPKFEPWLEDNPSYKKKYAKLSRSLQNVCQEFLKSLTTTHNKNTIHFMDCITMFCDKDTANMPGAVLGGKAKADFKYFCADRLHLSPHGYRLWEQEVKKILDRITNP